MSLISNTVQGTINQLEQQKKSEIERAKQKAMQEVIIPYNSEIDNARSKAIAEITEKANAEIAFIQQEANAKISKKQQELSDQKNELCEAGEKKKAEHSEATLIAVEAEVTARYANTLKTLYGIVENEKE
jgi:hypothetical protein